MSQPLLADAVAADQRMDVALDLHRLADVGAHDAHHAFVDLAFAHQGQQRQEQAFVEDLPAVGRLAEAADVDHVRGAGEQRHQLAVMEGGRGDDDVVEMAGALPRVVGHIGIARLHGLDRELADEMDDAARHRVHVARRAGDGLGQHLAVEVEHAGRDVARLARAGREGGAHQGAGLLLDDGEQAVPHHLQADIGGRAHVTSSSTIWPSGVDAGAKALRHDGGGAILDDQRRPVERHAGRERAAFMDGGLVVPARGRVEHLAMPPPGRRCSPSPARRRAWAAAGRWRATASRSAPRPRAWE